MQTLVAAPHRFWSWGMAVLAACALAVPWSCLAQTSRIDALFARLQTSSPEETTRIENEIIRLWSSSGSSQTDSLYMFARDNADRGNYRIALQLINRALGTKPDFAEAWNLRATIHYLRNNFPASIRDIETTLELNPRHFGAINGLALILEKSGRDELALAAYRRAAELSPNRRGLQGSIERVENRIRSRSH